MWAFWSGSLKVGQVYKYKFSKPIRMSDNPLDSMYNTVIPATLALEVMEVTLCGDWVRFDGLKTDGGRRSESMSRVRFLALVSKLMSEGEVFELRKLEA